MAKPRRKEDAPIIVGAVDVPVKHNAHIDGFGHFVNTGENGPYIEYSASKPKELKASTLLHEALHALSEFTGMDLSENQVAALEQHLPSLIVKNWSTFRPVFLKMNDGKPLH